jgi:glutaredoxin
MKVEIYSKADCSLCDEAKAVVLAVRQRLAFELVELDITADPDLYQRYRYDIPVIKVNGKFAFRHRVDERTFEARLRQEAP